MTVQEKGQADGIILTLEMGELCAAPHLSFLVPLDGTPILSYTELWYFFEVHLHVTFQKNPLSYC